MITKGPGSLNYGFGQPTVNRARRITHTESPGPLPSSAYVALNQIPDSTRPARTSRIDCDDLGGRPESRRIKVITPASHRNSHILTIFN